MKKEVKLDANGHRKFGIRDKIAYAAGDLGCNMSFSLKGTVQTFWLVYMMLETGMLAALLLIVQIWDALNDPMLGSLIDRDQRQYKHGKFKTYIFVGACGLLVGGAAVFLPFPDADNWLKAVLFIVGYVIWDAFYTVANVPYGSMLPLITSDKAQQAELSTWRSIGSIIGNILPGMILPMLIWRDIKYDGSPNFFDKLFEKIVLPEGVDKSLFYINPETNLPYKVGEVIINPLTDKNAQELLGERVFWAALIMGVLGFISFLIMLKNITIRVDESTVKTTDKSEKLNILSAFGKFMKNRPAIGATMAAMGMFLGMNAATTATTIMFATYFGMADLAGVVQMVGFLPSIFFIPFIKKIVVRFGKKEASVFGAVLSLIGSVIMLLFPLAPDNLALIVYMISLVIYGLGMGFYTCVSWAMMGDAIDYNEWKFGTREEGTVYSLHSFFRKLAQGVGPSVVLLIMGALGYVEKYGTMLQSAETAYNMCWLVAGLYMFSAVLQFVGLAFIYNIDKKTLEKMNTELAERHANNKED
jgi:GPH family glycoside/pentoside/hexuronide:cation symporter